MPPIGDTDGLLLAGEQALRSAGYLKSGDRVVILAGQSHTEGATNLLKVHTVA
jgi:pyruvate kinase